MPTPIIYSTTGAALSSDEISFAHQVAVAFSTWRISGCPKTIRREDPLTGAVVEYHADKNLAYVTPGGVTDYVGMTIPNPIPYRGVSIGLNGSSPGSSTATYIMTSDGALVASEPFSLTIVAGHQHLQYTPGFYYEMSGGNSVWMFDFDAANNNLMFNHVWTFTTPEDCIYPVPTVKTAANYPGIDGLGAQWAADWAAGVTAFNARRKAWFKKNSDEFIDALKTGFSPTTPGVTRAELQTGTLPPGWAEIIKTDVDRLYANYHVDANNISVGRHTLRPVQFSVSMIDTVESDTSNNLTQAGVKITRRDVAISYFAPGETTPRSESFIGYRTQTVTQHVRPTGALDYSQQAVYSNWYDSAIGGQPAAYYDLVDDPIGSFVDGAVQNGRDALSNPIPYIGWIPEFPISSVSISRSTPPFFATWHKDVKITYDRTGVTASTAQNDAALHGVTEIHISPVGTVADGSGFSPVGTSLGIFSLGADGGGEGNLQVEIYGTAVYNYNWQTGVFTFTRWSPLLDANGNEVWSKLVDLPAGTIWGNDGINCVVAYKGIHWPDIVRAINTEGPSSHFGVVSNAVVQALKAG